MRVFNSKQVRAELVQLIEKQIQTLAKETCGNLTAEDWRAYDARQKRIDELYDRLDGEKSAA